MGKILLYKGGLACQSLLGNTDSSAYSNAAIYVHPFLTVDGTEISALVYSTSTGTWIQNVRMYDGLTGYVSADGENDFSLSHYTAREISDISYSNSSSNQTGGKIYTIQATNGGSSEVTVKSVKFVKSLKGKDSSGNINKDTLIMGYFFDSPVTIGVGETKTFVVNFDS